MSGPRPAERVIPMFRITLILAVLFAVAGEGLAGEKDTTAAKAKAKAKACACLDIERGNRAAAAKPAELLTSQPIGPQNRTSPVAPPPARERFVIVSTTWCGPCQLLRARELPELRKAYAVEEVDGDEVKSHGATAYPTVIFERDGREAWRVTGYTAAATLKALAAEK